MKMFSCPTSSRILDVRSVERADRHGSVQLQLHVAGTGSLGAGQRNLFAEIGGGDDSFR